MSPHRQLTLVVIAAALTMLIAAPMATTSEAAIEQACKQEARHIFDLQLEKTFSNRDLDRMRNKIIAQCACAVNHRINEVGRVKFAAHEYGLVHLEPGTLPYQCFPNQTKEELDELSRHSKRKSLT